MKTTSKVQTFRWTGVKRTSKKNSRLYRTVRNHVTVAAACGTRLLTIHTQKRPPVRSTPITVARLLFPRGLPAREERKRERKIISMRPEVSVSVAITPWLSNTHSQGIERWLNQSLSLDSDPARVRSCGQHTSRPTHMPDYFQAWVHLKKDLIGDVAVTNVCRIRGSSFNLSVEDWLHQLVASAL